MRLHSKTIGVLILAFMLLLMSAVGFYFFYVLQDVLDIERQAALGNASRVREAFFAEQRQMRNVAIDWAGWDDSYNAMKDMTQEFADSWMTYESYKAMQISEIVFFDLEVKPLLALHVDSEKQEVTPLTRQAPILQEIAATGQLFDFTADPNGVAYFDMLDSRPVIIAASPIQDSKREKESRGTLVIVKYITAEMIVRISQQVQIEISLRPVPGALMQNEQMSVRLIDADRAAVTVPIAGLQDRTLFALDFTNPRPIYRQAWNTLQLFVVFWICASSAVLGLAGVLINRFVIARLKLISERLRGIHATRRFDEPLECSGSDEIAQMTQDINSMLATLSESHYYEVLNARDKAQAASQAKTNFMAKVSHELRTPIHGILGMVGILWRGSPDDETRLQLGMVRDSAIGLLGVVNDVLDFSKSESGELSVVCEPADIRMAVRKAMRVIAPRLFERVETEPLECVAEVDSRMPERIVTDGKRFTQILVNLMANAIKFTHAGSVHLVINWHETSASSGNLECIVHDTGIGIPAEKMEHLFKAFRQLDDSVNRAYQGTGLGLAIVKQLVTALNGTVSVASQPGIGSSFQFMLPVSVVTGEKSVARTPVLGKTVWIEDESNFESGRLFEAVRQAGGTPRNHQERIAASSSEAAPRGDFLILSAASLSAERGWNTLKSFIEREGADRVVVLVSAHQLTHRERLRAMGVKRMVLTPAVTQDIVRALEGTFAEDFSEYDDYVDIVPELSRSLEILVADDLMTNQIVLKSILQDMGHHVTVVGNGKELLDTLAGMYDQDSSGAVQHRFDIVMTDLQMPVMDGITALKTIRDWERQKSTPASKALPVFLVTAHAFEAEQQNMLAAGATEIITKPIDIKKLENAIRVFSTTTEQGI